MMRPATGRRRRWPRWRKEQVGTGLIWPVVLARAGCRSGLARSSALNGAANVRQMSRVLDDDAAEACPPGRQPRKSSEAVDLLNW